MSFRNSHLVGGSPQGDGNGHRARMRTFFSTAIGDRIAPTHAFHTEFSSQRERLRIATLVFAKTSGCDWSLHIERRTQSIRTNMRQTPRPPVRVTPNPEGPSSHCPLLRQSLARSRALLALRRPGRGNDSHDNGGHCQHPAPFAAGVLPQLRPALVR